MKKETDSNNVFFMWVVMVSCGWGWGWGWGGDGRGACGGMYRFMTKYKIQMNARIYGDDCNVNNRTIMLSRLGFMFNTGNVFILGGCVLWC